PVGPVPAGADAGAGVPALRVGRAVVVERPGARPAVVGGPGRVAALEEEIAPPVVAHDEDDVALQALPLGRQLAEVDPARPVPRDDQPGGRRTGALGEPLGADRGFRLDGAAKRPEPGEMPAALAAVVAQAVEVDDERRGRIRADPDLQGLAGPDAGAR